MNKDRTEHEWHESHNVSDSFFACYGCGVEAGDERLYKPCPTPDAVGQSRLARASAASSVSNKKGA